MMRKSPLQAIFVAIMALLALIGLAWGVYRMIFMPSTFDWSGIIVTLVLLGVVLYALRSSAALQGGRKQPKIKPSARTMAKVKAQQGNYKQVTKSSPFAKTGTPGRSTSASGGSKPKKHYPFQVIQGNKGKDDEEMPKYH
ncbi:hypothetical protein [Paenibacillus campi]|uniref:hypothetical protein n=1 Tax=Paenibacillus campi TaxID=3106031 RepID=UPI002AFEA3D6|nr:hypothetical protein [Paenibacillus sp. SGZ-1009]